jgi:hypothetical protein
MGLIHESCHVPPTHCPDQCLRHIRPIFGRYYGDPVSGGSAEKGGGLSQTDLQQLAGPRMSSQRGDKGGVLTRWVPTNLLEAIPPFLPDPAPHEGEWESAVTVDGQPVVQVAKLRSDPEGTPYMSAVAWIDQKHARFVLHPGSQEPGGGGLVPARSPSG